MKGYWIVGSIVVFLAALGMTGFFMDINASPSSPPCAQPTKLVEIKGLRLGGGVSMTEAKGKIEAALGREIEVDFEERSPDTWSALASTYQYQTCQSVYAIPCGDLSKQECFTQKQKILDGAFDKINNLMTAEKDKQVQIKVDACVAQRVAGYEEPKNTFTQGGARASSPGIDGGRKTATENLCHSVGENQRILSAKTQNTSCHGGRCSVTEPRYENDYKKVCVTTKAWSESKAFGGGGSGQYKLIVTYQDIVTPELRNNFAAVCAQTDD